MAIVSIVLDYDETWPNGARQVQLIMTDHLGNTYRTGPIFCAVDADMDALKVKFAAAQEENLAQSEIGALIDG